MRKKGQCKTAAPALPVPALSPEEEQELDYYVCCSIEEIENILSKNSSEKQKKLAEVSLRILRNPAETFIKKKQIMRQWFDDYKKKFDNKKTQTVNNLNENKCIIKKAVMPTKSVFFRKHEVRGAAHEECSSENSENFSEENKNIFNFKTCDNSFRFAF